MMTNRHFSQLFRTRLFWNFGLFERLRPSQGSHISSYTNGLVLQWLQTVTGAADVLSQARRTADRVSDLGGRGLRLGCHADAMLSLQCALCMSQCLPPAICPSTARAAVELAPFTTPEQPVSCVRGMKHYSWCYLQWLLHG